MSVPRESDAVVAIHDITSSLTGASVPGGTNGVVLKQTGAVPATYRVRFISGEKPGLTVVLDDLTDRDIALATAGRTPSAVDQSASWNRSQL